MLRICTIKSSEAAKTYYTDPHAVDYYTAGLEKPGVWGGLGAEKLGLVGAVDKEDFHKLCDNTNPHTNKQWTSRNKANRRVGYDFNFHAPKSVSVLHALTGDEAICVAFERSVFETMQQIEKDMATRVRKGGLDVDRNTGNLVWSQFTHLATRPVGYEKPKTKVEEETENRDGKKDDEQDVKETEEKVLPDPHMHVHAVAFNGTWDSVENCWKAGQFGEIKFDARYFEACFYSRLVQGLQDLGYDIERTEKGWEIAGVNEEIRDHFSNRTKEINKAKQGHDLTAKQEAMLGQDTRRKKREADKMTSLELKSEWLDRIGLSERLHLNEIFLRARNRRAAASPRHSKEAVERATDFALKHVFERKSVDSERGVIAEAIRSGLGVARHDAIESAVRSREMIRYNDAGRIWCTTDEVIEEERFFIDFCKEGQFAHEAFHPDPKKAETGHLSDQQIIAMRQILGSRNRVTALRGRAGTGKTTMMTATIKAFQAAGHRVKTFAPTSDAAKNTLRKEGFKDAETVQRLLVDPSMAKKISGSILWIDEAGLLSAKQMAKLAELAQARDCRLILSGDTSQHSSVERGDALRILEKYGGLKPAELDCIYRQQDPIYREAVRLISDGQVDQAFDHLEGVDAIKEIRWKDRYQRLAQDYVLSIREMDDQKQPRTTLCVSPTHEEGAYVTTAIRGLLKAQGHLRGESSEHQVLRSINWTEAQRGEESGYKVLAKKMDEHYILLNQKAGDFPKGFRGKIFTAHEGELWLQDDHGNTQTLDLKRHAGKFDVLKKEKLELMPGDRVRITRNSKSIEGKPLHNGTLHTVESIDASGRVNLGKDMTLPNDFVHFAHGYCTTSHASQGKTVDNVLIAQSSGGFAASSLQQFYVSASRGRRRIRIYTDDKDALRDAVRHARIRKSASDYWRDPKVALASRKPSLLRRVVATVKAWPGRLLPNPNKTSTIKEPITANTNNLPEIQ